VISFLYCTLSYKVALIFTFHLWNCICFVESSGNSVGIVVKLGPGQSGIQIAAGEGYIYLLQSVHTGFGAHPASYWICTWGWSVQGVRLTTHFHPLPGLRMGEAVTPFSCFVVFVEKILPLSIATWNFCIQTAALYNPLFSDTTRTGNLVKFVCVCVCVRARARVIKTSVLPS